MPRILKVRLSDGSNSPEIMALHRPTNEVEAALHVHSGQNPDVTHRTLGPFRAFTFRDIPDSVNKSAAKYGIPQQR